MLTKAIRCLLQSRTTSARGGSQSIELIVAQLPVVVPVGHANYGGVQSITARMAGQLMAPQKQHDAIENFTRYLAPSIPRMPYNPPSKSCLALMYSSTNDLQLSSTLQAGR